MDVAVPFAVVSGSTALDATLGEGTDPVNLVMDIVGFGAQEALEFMVEAAVGGPIAMVIITIFQSANMLIDTLWDPLAGYFNKDLDAMKSQYDSAYRYNLAIQASAGWPLQRKPVLLDMDKDGNLSEADRTELLNFRKKWYQDHNLITQDDQVNIVKIGDYMQNRQLAYASYNPVLKTLSDTKTNILSVLINNDLELIKLIAFAVKKRKGLPIATLPAETDAQIADYKQKVAEAKAASKTDVQTHIIILLCIALSICCFCCICGFGSITAASSA